MSLVQSPLSALIRFAVALAFVALLNVQVAAAATGDGSAPDPTSSEDVQVNTKWRIRINDTLVSSF